MLVIPKVNMPTGCDECPLAYDGCCSAMYAITGEVTSLPDYCCYSKTKRAEFCPLIEKKPGIRILKES